MVVVGFSSSKSPKRLRDAAIVSPSRPFRLKFAREKPPKIVVRSINQDPGRTNDRRLTFDEERALVAITKLVVVVVALAFCHHRLCPHCCISKAGVSNLFLQRASYKFKNVVRAAYKKLMIIQTPNDELKLYLFINKIYNFLYLV